MSRRPVWLRFVKLASLLSAIWLAGAVCILIWGKIAANEGISPSEVAGELFLLYCTVYGLVGAIILTAFVQIWILQSRTGRQRNTRS